MTERLEVLYAGMRVAELISVGLHAGASLRYTQEAIEGFGEGTPLLSVRLPIRKAFYPATQTKRFLEGLLPEDHVRASLADNARVASEDTFGLLRAYGMDCVGAIQVIDPSAAAWAPQR